MRISFPLAVAIATIAPAALVCIGAFIVACHQEDVAAAGQAKHAATLGPSSIGPNLQSDTLQSIGVLDVEPQPLTYADAGQFVDGGNAPLAWTPATPGRYPTHVLVSNSANTTQTYQTVCMDLVGVNGTAGAVNQCLPLESNIWHSVSPSRIYQQADSGVVYVGY